MSVWMHPRLPKTKHLDAKLSYLDVKSLDVECLGVKYLDVKYLDAKGYCLDVERINVS